VSAEAAQKKQATSASAKFDALFGGGGGLMADDAIVEAPEIVEELKVPKAPRTVPRKVFSKQRVLE
jgi:hypothetical protein